MAITLDGTNGITTPDLESSGPVIGTTGTFSGNVSGVAGTFSGAVQASGVTTNLYPLVSETAKAFNWNGVSTNTFIDFTGIPSWVKRITVMFQGVSTSGTSIKQIQLGTSSGVVTTGYLNGTSILAGTVASQNTTTGFGLYSISASDNLSGGIVISNITGNTWSQYGNLCITGASNISIISAGSLALSGVLDRIRITTVNGTDTFDAGTVNIMYE